MKQSKWCNKTSAGQEPEIEKQTTAPISAQAVVPIVPATTAARPEFIRLPRPGALCPFTGLSRGKLNQFVLPCVENGFRPPVKSISLRKLGSIKGVRLVEYASLISYLRGFANEDAAGNPVGGSARRQRSGKSRM